MSFPTSSIAPDAFKKLVQGEALQRLAENRGISTVALTKAMCVARMPDMTHERLTVAVAELDDELEHAGSDPYELASFIEKKTNVTNLNAMD